MQGNSEFLMRNWRKCARRAVPGDRKSARRRCARRKDFVLSFFLRADACGLYIGEADCFFRLRGRRTMRTRFHRVKPGRHSWVRRKAIFNGRKLRRAFSDLFLSFIKEPARTSSASVSAHTKEKAYLVQVRTIQYW